MSAAPTFPVVEVFGPTIQGEGALAGLPTLFVRFGGCDYRCSWCDSMFAVDPAQVREHAERLTEPQIAERCLQLIGGRSGPNPPPGMWVTLSGGNPALMRFDTEEEAWSLCAHLHAWGFRVAVETQGALWRDWLGDVDHLVVSPKPPSSGMVTDMHTEQTGEFLSRTEATLPRSRRSMKIVVFDQDDLDWARNMIVGWRGERGEYGWDTYLSVGTDPYTPSGMIADALEVADYEADMLRRSISDRYRWLCEAAAADPAFRETRVLPQLHVVAWGHARGV